MDGLREKTDLIVLPEMFNTGFTMQAKALGETMDGKTVQWMKKIAYKYECVVTGSIIIAENNQLFNRMLWITPDGEIQHYDKHHLFNRMLWVTTGGEIQHYDKHHLFSLGEEDEHFSAGQKQLIVTLKGWKIRLAVCYDLRFPVWLRNKQEGYDILLVVASWPDQRSAHWLALIPARAIENQSYVIGVNRVGHDGNQIYRSGHSMCIDPLGNTIYYKPEDEDLYTFSINYLTLEKARRQFPFLQDADDFGIN